MVSYPDQKCGEDTVALEVLAKQQPLHLLDRPELYLYTFHSGNTVGRAHWTALLNRSTALSWDESREVLARSGSDRIELTGRSVRDHLEPTRYWFEQARRHSRDPMRTLFFRFADAPVRMRVLGQRWRTSAEQLRATASRRCRARWAVRLDDRCLGSGHNANGVSRRADSTDRTHLLDRGLITIYDEHRIIRYERGHYVNSIDRGAREIFTWREDGNDQGR